MLSDHLVDLTKEPVYRVVARTRDESHREHLFPSEQRALLRNGAETLLAARGDPCVGCGLEVSRLLPGILLVSHARRATRRGLGCARHVGPLAAQAVLSALPRGPLEVARKLIGHR